ncbi:MAG: ankyrin repeat domain-containing protein, partial [Alphaproteobacteria bacterium]|nr:ankyrin repeat domain-containing protein [Alphaproteobacteria bacterium]
MMEPDFIAAIRSGHVEHISHFLQNGADVNGQDERKWSPLMHAIWAGN